jgi:hypothetical protein
MFRECPPIITIAISPSILAAAETRKVAQILLQRAGGPAPENFAGTADFLVTQDAGASAENDSRADVSVLSEAYLAA